MSHDTEKRESWEIGLDITGEATDKLSRLKKIKGQLEKRIEAIDPVIDELTWIIRTIKDQQKNKHNIEFIEGQREHFQEIVDYPGDDLYSETRVFAAIVEHCDALLSETSVAS